MISLHSLFTNCNHVPRIELRFGGLLGFKSSLMKFSFEPIRRSLKPEAAKFSETFCAALGALGHTLTSLSVSGLYVAQHVVSEDSKACQGPYLKSLETCNCSVDERATVSIGGSCPSVLVDLLKNSLRVSSVVLDFLGRNNGFRASSETCNGARALSFQG